LEDHQRRGDRFFVVLSAPDRKRPAMREDELEQSALEQLRLGHESHRSRKHDADEPMVHLREVIGGEDDGPPTRNPLDLLGV
jgi:hypothetical protein